MPSESGEQQSRSPAAQNYHHHHNHNQNGHLAPPPQTEALPCPRCDSSNTKFCYYNNYNLSQPRHFCKSCRRYWTHGGTLRDVPVGGGSRKTTKRSRSSSAAATSSSSSSSSSGFVFPHLPLVTKPEPVHDGSASDDPANPNPSGNECPSSNGIGFTSLLNSQTPGGFLALGGQGYGYGLDELSGFGYGAKPAWPFHEVAEFGGGAGHNTWQIATGSEVGLVDGSSVDCFVWPDLSISMPGGNGLK